MAEAGPCSTHYDQSVLSALEEKYLDTDHNEDYIKTAGIQILHNLTSIKAGGTPLPQCLALNYCHISKAGDAVRLHELCRRVRELDVAENELKDWNEVLNIISEIPHLEFLNLSSNPLNCKMDLNSKPTTRFTALKKMALNSTMVPWETVYDLLDIMPGVEELNLSLNDYSNIPSPPNNKTYPQLYMLQFNENHISQWEQLCPVGQAFPQLTSLILIGNNLSGQITTDVTANFPKLSCLNLTNTYMQSWEELESLNNFSALVDVRLQGIPFCEGIPEKDRRQLCIARLPSVMKLNGSQIKELERENADRFFIRYYMDMAENEKPGRYKELIKKYGHLNRLADIDLQPKNKVKVTLEFEDKTEVMYISVKQTIREFKKSLSKFACMPASKLRYYYGDQDIQAAGQSHAYWQELKYNTTMVSSLRARDGDRFMLERR